MKDTIYRDDAIRVASGYCHWTNIPKELAKLPSAQPEPSEIARDIADIIENEMDMRVIRQNAQERKTGRWIPLQLSLEHPPYQCSCCFSNPPMITKKDNWRKQHLEAVLSPYCPNCGARMEVEHD